MQNHAFYGVKFLCGLITLFICSSVLTAQVQPITGVDPSAGLSAAPWSQRGAGTSTIVAAETNANTTTILGSQSYTYTIPLLNLPGRAGFDVNLNLYYNSKIWPLTNIFTNADYDTPSVGFRLDYGMFDYGGTIMDPDGTKHPLMTVNDVDPRYYVHYQTTDSSYIQIRGSKYVGVCPGPLICQQPNLTVTFKGGINGIYENFNFQHGGGFRPIQFTDTHGNQISISYLDGVSLHIASITDTVGRVIAFTYDSGGRLSSFGYGQHNFTFSWNQSYQLRFNFGTLTTQGPISVLTQVTRPNGTAVRFQYGDWGIVNEIDELSSSGITRYSTAYNFPAASAGALSENPTFTTQTVFDGVSSNLQWHYAVTTSDSGVSTVAVTGPTQVTTTDTLSTDGLLIERRITTGGSQNATPWRIIEQSWGTDSASVNSRVTARSTILENGAASGTVFASYDANGNPTDVKDYDFGAPSSANLSLSPGTIPSSFGALLREVVATYAPLSGILNRPQQILMKDGQGTTIARTDYNYDEGSSSVHGDLTSMLRYTNAATGSGSIQTSITYDGYGNRVTMQEACCRFAQSTFSATTNFAYPDSTSVGPQGSQLTSTYTYNADGSVATATDPTGVVLTYGYDSSGRITSVGSSSGLTTSSSFDDSSLNATVRVSSNANSSAKMRTLDGIGRPIYDQRFDGTTLVSTVKYINDELGRAVQISNPYGPNATPVYRNVLYDALDRVTQSTPPAATAGGSQNSYTAAYSGTNVLFTDPAGRERRNYTDALGRLVRVEEPGLSGGGYATGSLTIAGTELSVSTSSGNGASSGTATVSLAGT
jgi:YD repeat-containing protein